MRRTPVIGGVLLFLGMGVALAGGVRDVGKNIQTLKSGATAKDRAAAAEMLGKRGSVNYNAVEEAIGPLKESLKDKDAAVRGAAAVALGQIHPEPKETVPLLIDMVKGDASLDAKLSAVYALGLFGNDAHAAVPALRELAGNFKEKKDKRVAREIQMSLKQITGKKK